MIKIFIVIIVVGLKIKCVYQTSMALDFARKSIVPDLIPVPPVQEAVVVFGDEEAYAKGGNRLHAKEVEYSPIVFWKSRSDILHTLILLDMDAPTRTNPIFRAAEHWTVINIPGCDIPRGEVLTPYFIPSPPKGVGVHRYVFLVYQQQERIMFTDIDELKETATARLRFRPVEFAEQNNLGNPIAGNIFISESDDNSTIYDDEDATQEYLIYYENKFLEEEDNATLVGKDYAYQEYLNDDV